MENEDNERYEKEIELAITEWLKNSHLSALQQQEITSQIAKMEKENSPEKNQGMNYLVSIGLAITQTTAESYVKGFIEYAPADASCVLASFISHEISDGGKNNLGEINNLNEHYADDIRWIIIIAVEFIDFLRGTQLTDPIDPDRLNAFIPSVKDNKIIAMRYRLVSSLYFEAAGLHDSLNIITPKERWQNIFKKLNCESVSNDPIYQEIKRNRGSLFLRKSLKYVPPEPVSNTTLMRHSKAISSDHSALPDGLYLHCTTALIYMVDAVQKKLLADKDLSLEKISEYFAELPNMHREFRGRLIKHSQNKSTVCQA